MKKFALILVIASMVVLDLFLSGEDVLMGLILLTGAALASYGLDQAHQQKKENKEEATCANCQMQPSVE